MRAPQALAVALRVPPVQYADFIAITQSEPGNVYGAALGMFRQSGTVLSVLGTA